MNKGGKQTHSSQNLKSESNKYQVAMLLHYLSDEALNMYNGFHFDGEENGQTVEDVMQKFEEFAVESIIWILARSV